ncbi:MAG: YfhO family protein [Methylococcales bacterium]|nr:YfhO family protein [Methylococcales bacterium]
MHDTPLRKTLGCGTPKLRLVSNIRYAKTQAEAARDIAITDIYQQPVILSLDLKAAGLLRPQAASQRHTLRKVSKIQDFTANRLQLFIDNPSSSTAWLIYADAFNPKWQASIDGQPQAISPTNLAFKGIPIKPGRHEVKFSFTGQLKDFMLFWLMMCGVACAVLLRPTFPRWLIFDYSSLKVMLRCSFIGI